MKKLTIMAMMLLASMATFAQAKSTAKEKAPKWKVRLRIIDAIPPSTSYKLTASDVKISSSVVPELDFSYYFNKFLAAELILGTTHHKVSVKSSTASTELGKIWLLPPTLNLQFHYPIKNFEPYVGAGINYTIFYGAKDEAASLGYKNRAGFSTQLGFDYKIGKKFFLNFDMKKIFLKTDVTIKGTPSTVLSNVKVDPFVIGLGAGLQF